LNSELFIEDERYTIEARIGSGAMATVFRAYDRRLQRIVALKILHDHLAGNKELRLRFEQEAKLAARIDHPNVVRIYDIGLNKQNQIYIVSEFIDGRSLTLALRQYMNSPHPYLNPILAAMVGHEIAKGMDAAHRHSVLHRDLKPDNVLVSNAGQVKLTDFGVARPFDSSMTQAGQFIGSLSYASPEQIHGSKIDARSDIFSYGVILFELLTGQLPFRSTNSTDLALKISQAKVPPLNQFRNSIPIELDSLVRKCLRVDPSERPAQAEQIVRELSSFIIKNEAECSNQSIQNGFENPKLFSSTIRRSPILVTDENSTQTTTTDSITSLEFANVDFANKRLEVQTPEPNLEKKSDTLEKPSTEVNFQTIADLPPKKKAEKNKIAQIRNKANDAMTVSQGRLQRPGRSSPWSHLMTFIFLIFCGSAVIFVLHEKIDFKELLISIRDSIPDVRPENLEEQAKTASRTSRSHEPSPNQVKINPTQTPFQVPSASGAQMMHSPVPEPKSPAPSPQPTQTQRQVTKAKSPQNQVKVQLQHQPEPRKTTLSTSANRMSEQTRPKSSATTAATATKPTELPSGYSQDNKASSLQIVTNPGSRTLNLIRRGKKEFIGLSARSHTSRTFQKLEQGPALLQIPAEEVDGRKYEGHQIQINLEPGKPLSLPLIQSRVIASVVIRCDMETRITKLNNKRIVHRGGPMTYEAPLNSFLDIQGVQKSGLQVKASHEILNDGQELECPGSLRKDR
jgi:serine/threonine protein kinase